MGLADDVRLASDAVSIATAAIERSESRLAYRKEHGRTLSSQHEEALSDLLAALDSLRGRLASLVGPDADALRREFAELQERLADMEVHDGE